jgi:mannose-6-phosphate isomerase-like protein (cupin superfamily)
VGDRFENARTGATMEMVRVPGPDGGVLEVRRLLKPGTGRTVPHMHLDYVERFAIEQGQASAKLDGRALTLGPGDELEVPLESTHVNPYNASDQDLVLRHTFEPASEFALGYVETLGHLMLEGRTDRQGEAPLSAAFAVGHHTRSHTYAGAAPHGLQRSVLFPLGARIAKLRGYPLHLPGG